MALAEAAWLGTRAGAQLTFCLRACTPPAACAFQVCGISLYPQGHFGQQGWLVHSSSPIIIVQGCWYWRGNQLEGPSGLGLHQDVAQGQYSYLGRMPKMSPQGG